MGWRYFSEIETGRSLAAPGDRRRGRRRRVADRPGRASRRDARTSCWSRADGVLTGSATASTIEIAVGPETSPRLPLAGVQRDHRASAWTDTAEIDVVYLEPVTLEPTSTRQRYELHGARASTPRGTIRRRPMALHGDLDWLDERALGRGRRRRALRPRVRAGSRTSRGRRAPGPVVNRAPAAHSLHRLSRP